MTNNVIASDLQKQDAGGAGSELVELFILELPDHLSTEFSRIYFHAGTLDSGGSHGSVTFRDREQDPLTGNYELRTYIPLPMNITGIASEAEGVTPRPSLTVANLSNIFRGALGEYSNEDLIRCKIIRRRTFKDQLATGSNTAPPIEFPVHSYKIDRISSETAELVTYELVAPYDLEGITLPRREIIGKYCSWIYQGFNHTPRKGACHWELDGLYRDIVQRQIQTITESTSPDRYVITVGNNHGFAATQQVTFGRINGGSNYSLNGKVFEIATTTNTEIKIPITDVDGTTHSFASVPAHIADTGFIRLNSTTGTLHNFYFDKDDTPLVAASLFGNSVAGDVKYIDWNASQTYSSGRDNDTEPAYARTGSAGAYSYWRSRNNANTNNDPLTNAGKPYWTQVFVWSEWQKAQTIAVGDYKRFGLRISRKLITTGKRYRTLPVDDSQDATNYSSIGGDNAPYAEWTCTGNSTAIAALSGDGTVEELDHRTVWIATIAHTSSFTNLPKNSSRYWSRGDICGKTLRSCKIRYGAIPQYRGSSHQAPSSEVYNQAALPFGAYPAAIKFK